MRRVKCFAEQAARLGPYQSLDCGPRVIEVARITGTVDKCGELDSRFRLIRRRADRREGFRRRRLKLTDLAVTQLPPISVYLLAGEYYVIDGNRRVAAAKQHGLEFMDAYLTECIPLADRAALEGASARRRFEQETGLRNVRLAHEAGYAALLEEALAFRPEGAEGLSARDRARRWHAGFFLPACGLIRASALSKRFPQAEAGDLFVTVSRFYRGLLGGYPAGASYATLLSGFSFAERVPARRPFRAAPFRFLLGLLGARAGGPAARWAASGARSPAGRTRANSRTLT